MMLDKQPNSPNERKQLLGKLLENEAYLDNLEISNIQRRIIEFLLCKKGYHSEDIEVNKIFKVKLRDVCFDASADIIIKIKDKNIIFVKCVTNSLDSWERYAIAFCRIVDAQIPFAMITDGETVRLLNTLNGSVTDGKIDLVLSRSEVEGIIHETIFQSFSQERKEMEKRIIYAFEGIKCPVKSDI